MKTILFGLMLVGGLLSQSSNIDVNRKPLQEFRQLSFKSRTELARKCNEPAVAKLFEGIFRTEQDSAKKGAIAQLMCLNHSDDTRYIEYLLKNAQAAVDSQAPTVYQSTSEGEVKRGQRNPQFEMWCRFNGKDIDEEVRRQLIDNPSSVMLLADIAVPATSPVFVKGLQSSNPLVAVYSAFGLSGIGDKTFIPLIIDAAIKAHINIDGQMVATLAKFKNADALIQTELRGTRLLPLYKHEVEHQSESDLQREKRKAVAPIR